MSELRIAKFTSETAAKWDSFVGNSINGTLFHSRRFISYHPQDRFLDESLMIYRGDELFAVFPAAGINDEGVKVFKSHPGTSYGGLVIASNIKLRQSFEIFQVIEDFAKNAGYERIDFRIAPKIFFKRPCDQIDFALVHRGFIREAEELSTCYYLKDFIDLEEDNLSKYNFKRKNIIRQGIRNGLEISIAKSDEELSRFYEILTDNLKKHNTKPVHSLVELMDLTKRLSSEVEVVLVKSKDEIISGFLLLRINHKGKHIFYSAVDYAKQHLRPVNYGLYSLIKKLAREGYEYLNFGISTEKGGKYINWGLFDFKENFDGCGIIRTYWLKEL